MQHTHTQTNRDRLTRLFRDDDDDGSSVTTKLTLCTGYVGVAEYL